ncbi:hypothetical protein B0H67DRAFT_646974 [Lasiosphaeris hirsuta]|uniref:DUF2423 domain-containing protein n=1 Tax=Lasiosphaeris hirsuta TaxID=260670 RepID=A0AA40DPT4_9PEZI|nr:hypothetical protein B0H67DRAFT_646974 [Lasiosphaeris hirsuta]
MAKSSRSSQIKTNNQKLKRNVFGPIEAARLARISAKLTEIAAQPKPLRDVDMEIVNEDATAEIKDATAEKTEVMEVDSGAKPASSKPEGRSRIEKRRSKRNPIVFAKYGEHKGSSKFSKKKK